MPNLHQKAKGATAPFAVPEYDPSVRFNFFGIARVKGRRGAARRRKRFVRPVRSQYPFPLLGAAELCELGTASRHSAEMARWDIEKFAARQKAPHHNFDREAPEDRF